MSAYNEEAPNMGALKSPMTNGDHCGVISPRFDVKQLYDKKTQKATNKHNIHIQQHTHTK